MLEAHIMLQRMEEIKQDGEKKEEWGFDYRPTVLLKKGMKNTYFH